MIPQIHGIMNFGIGVVPPDPVLDHIDNIPDGEIEAALPFSFQITNSGGAGNVTVYYEIYESGDVLYTNGSEEIAIAEGTDDYNIYGLAYPGDPGSYYVKAWIDVGDPQNSNVFSVT